MNQVPTICQVLHGMEVGGAEVLAMRLARALGDRYRFVFACLDHVGTLGEQLRADGFPVHLIERRAGLDLACCERLARVFRRECVDLVFAHQYTPFSYSLLGRLRCRRPPILFIEHGRHVPDYPRRKRIVFNRLMLQRRDRVVAVGNAVRDALITNEGIPQDRITVIHNGIDFDAYAPDMAVRAAARSELGLDEQHVALIQVARLDMLKDHHTSIAAFARLAEAMPNARFLIVGDGPLRGAIENQIEQLGLGAKIHLLGQRGDVPRLLNAADIAVLSSISEGIPLTLIEAMAAGLPIASTDVGGVREVLGIDRASLVEARDSLALGNALASIAANLPCRSARRAADENSLAPFSEARMHEQYTKMADGMIGPPVHPRQSRSAKEGSLR